MTGQVLPTSTHAPLSKEQRVVRAKEAMTAAEEAVWSHRQKNSTLLGHWVGDADRCRREDERLVCALRDSKYALDTALARLADPAILEEEGATHE